MWLLSRTQTWSFWTAVILLKGGFMVVLRYFTSTWSPGQISLVLAHLLWSAYCFWRSFLLLWSWCKFCWSFDFCLVSINCSLNFNIRPKMSSVGDFSVVVCGAERHFRRNVFRLDLGSFPSIDDVWTNLQRLFTKFSANLLLWGSIGVTGWYLKSIFFAYLPISSLK